MSNFTVSSVDMWDVLGVPAAKAPINIATFLSYVLPPLLFYFVMAIMAITPHTRALRVAFWPVLALLACHGAFSVDMAPNNPEEKFHIDLAVSGSRTIMNPKTHARERLIRWIPDPDALHRYSCPLLGTDKRPAREANPT